MKERPILMSGEMVRAILDGRKTQTRRVVKPKPAYPDAFIGKRMEWSDERQGVLIWNNGAVAPGHFWRCPYGKPGDLLWVKETFSWIGDGFTLRDLEFLRAEQDINLIYRADDTFGAFDVPWTPSIHMPRWASRLTLRITDVRVERLQDISEEDARAEGASAHRWFQPVGKPDLDGVTLGASGEKWNPTWDAIYYKNGFANLWESINGKDSWDANPWVWVIGFEVVK